MVCFVDVDEVRCRSCGQDYVTYLLFRARSPSRLKESANPLCCTLTAVVLLNMLSAALGVIRLVSNRIAYRIAPFMVLLFLI